MLGPVEAVALSHLELLRPAIKREWEALLRAEPTLSPLADPDILVFLMDATLNQVFADVARDTEGRWRGHVGNLRRPLQRHCACGRNPLLNYYATGELALHAGAGPALGSALDEVLVPYHALAQREIGTFCSVCQRQEAGERRPASSANASSA